MDAFLKGLRKHPLLAKSIIVFCAERNTGHDAGYLADVVKNYPPFHLVTQRGYEGRHEKMSEDDYGFWTNARSKDRQAQHVWSIMTMNEPGLLQNWICENPFMDPDTRKLETLEKTRDQLLRYHQDEKGRYTGKTDLSGNPGYNDDIATTIFMTLFINALMCDGRLPQIPPYVYKK